MYYLIDTENVGVSNWLTHKEKFADGDTIIFFVNEEAGGSIPILELAKIKRTRTKILIEECSPGKNSMDLSIAAKCGELFNKERRIARSYIIVSNDCGYDGFINTCRHNGHNISRMTGLFVEVVPGEAVVPATAPVKAPAKVSAKVPTKKEKKAKAKKVKLSKKQNKAIASFCKKYGVKNETKLRTLATQAINGGSKETYGKELLLYFEASYKGEKLGKILQNMEELHRIVFPKS